MENPQSSSFTSLFQSRRFLIAAGFILLLVLVGVGIFFILSSKPPLEPIPEGSVYTPDEVTVQFAQGYTPAPQGENENWDRLYAKLQELGVQSYSKVFDSNDPDLSRYYKLKLSSDAEVATIREELYKLDEIKASEPEYILSTQLSANDAEYSGMWGLKKIDIEKAWDVTRGSNSVKVAVVDTGIDYNHPDFAGRSIIKGKDVSTCDSTYQELLASNGQCTKPKQPDNDPLDSNNGHGTHVAGTIGAATNNGIGVSGVNWNVTLIAVKTMGEGGAGGMSEIANGLVDAVDRGADVVNMSLGGEGTCTSQMQQAINYARNKGAAIVVAAGNGDRNGNPIDASRVTPASCTGVIVVGATGPNDERSSYSNYGTRVDLAAPGGNEPRGTSSCTKSNCITSTWPGRQYRSVQGTSMAAPHVAGVAALLLAQNGSLTPDDIKRCLINSGNPISTDRPIGGKRLNAYSALNGCIASANQPTTPPANPPTATPTDTQAQTPAIEPSEYYLKGFTYSDANNNLTFDSGETMVAGVILKLTDESNVNTNIPTGADGKFEFRNLKPGSYLLTATVGTRDVMEYRIGLDLNMSSQNIPIPIPSVEPSDPDNPSQGENRVIITGSPTPTPRPLHTCVEKTTQQRVNNRVLQLKYLDCTPI